MRRDLQSKSKSHLLRLAKRSKVAGADRLSKEQLVRGLLKKMGGAGRAPTGKAVRTIRAAARRTHHPTGNGVVAADLKRVDGLNGARERHKGDDRVVLMVRDPYWLHVYWEISTETIQRTETALDSEWYRAKPVLRLMDVSSDDATISSETLVRELEIHGGVNNWYIDVDGRSRTYRVDVGYRTEHGRFHAIARSNAVSPPAAGESCRAEGHFRSVREECERIFAMSGGANASSSEALQKFFEEKFRRPLSAGSLSNYGSGALGSFGSRSFHFELNAELIVFGKTVPDAHVTVGGEPVRLRRDGSFTLRKELSNGRQVLPATAETNDGIEVRTIVLAVERNTKELEPLIHDGQEL